MQIKKICCICSENLIAVTVVKFTAVANVNITTVAGVNVTVVAVKDDA